MKTEHEALLSEIDFDASDVEPGNVSGAGEQGLGGQDPDIRAFKEAWTSLKNR